MSYKCKGHDCPIRQDCYRYTREPDKNQQYYKNTPYQENGGKCDFYLPKWVLDELKTNKHVTNNNNSNKERREVNQQRGDGLDKA